MPDTIWRQVTVTVPKALEDPLADFLTTLTERGVRIREGTSTTMIDAYLSPEVIENQLILIERHLYDLVQMGLLPEGTGYEVEDLPEEDWMAVFRSQHTTVRISDRLVVRPTWCDPVNGHEIVLDPGMAFGTGSHPTTRLCLLLLDRITGTRPPQRMFDLGTGSGILAIAGAHLGIEEIIAVDIDPVSVDVAVRNTAANAVNDRIRVLEGGVESAEGLYDVITANISAPLLKKLAHPLVRHLKPGGHIILSGIFEDEWEGVREAYEGEGLVEVQTMMEKVWVAALLQRAHR